jgi:hypothetical protein
VRSTAALLGAAIGGRGGSSAGAEALARALPARTRAAVVGSAVVPSPPLHDADYWQFADWLAGALDRLWSGALNTYTADTRINSSALMTHSIAALVDHQGECRRDARARDLALRLCESPPFRAPRNGRPTRHTDPRSESQAHAPGWVANIGRLESDQHITIDPKVWGALYLACLARDQLGFSGSVIVLLVELVLAVSYSPLFC